MICPRCKNQFADFQFCLYCGVALVDETSNSFETETVVIPKQKSDNRGATPVGPHGVSADARPLGGNAVVSSNKTFARFLYLTSVAVLMVAAVAFAAVQLRAVYLSPSNSSNPANANVRSNTMFLDEQPKRKKQVSKPVADENEMLCILNDKAILHKDCDSQDCDNDPGTVEAKLMSGEAIYVSNIIVPSSLDSVVNWLKVSGKNSYVAQTKIDCE